MSVTVISSVYGDYDHIAPPVEQTVPTDWIMVTDGRTPIPDGWHTVIEPRDQLHPRVAAKVAKCSPELYTDSEVVIWIDASFDVLSETFVDWCVSSIGDEPIAQIVHPHRQSIMDEAEVSRQMEKYNGQAVIEQARHYILDDEHPASWGLWATGLMVRRPSRRTADFGRRWLAEQVRWTYQDQISEPYVLRRCGLRPVSLSGPLWGHHLFGMHGHRSDK